MFVGVGGSWWVFVGVGGYRWWLGANEGGVSMGEGAALGRIGSGVVPGGMAYGSTWGEVVPSPRAQVGFREAPQTTQTTQTT